MKFFEDNFPDWLSGVNFKKLVTIGSSTTSANLTVNGTITTNGLVNTGSSVGSLKNVVNATATLAPTAAQSGTLFTLNAAAGFTTTLPTPAVGLDYTFVVGTLITSNTYKIITNTSSVYLQGLAEMGYGTEGDVTFFNSVPATTNLSYNIGATATAGLIGSWLHFVCVSATLWQVDAHMMTTTTPTTPWATS